MDLFQHPGNSNEVFVAIGERPKRSVFLLAKNPVDDLANHLPAEYPAIQRALETFEQPNHRAA